MKRIVTIGVLLLVLSAPGAPASTSATSNDALDTDLADDARMAPSAATPVVAPPPAVSSSPAPPSERALSANPLWAIPLSRLSGTRDRPIFSSSRRPAPAAVAAQPVVAKAAPAPKKREPDRPPLSLVGTIAGGDEGFGIFVDAATKAALRLKLGDDYQGWRLQSIHGREVTLEKDDQAAVLSLPKPGAASSGEVRLLPSSSIGLPRSLVNPVAEHFR